MKASLRTVIAAAEGRGIPMPVDTAAFVALVVAEELSARPARVSTASVAFTDGADIAVVPGATEPAAPQEAAGAVRSLLTLMLAHSPAEVAARYQAVASAPAGDLTTLRREIEERLSPLNRSRARRVLERYLRDVLRGFLVIDEDTPVLVARRDTAEEILRDLSSPFLLPSEPPPAPPDARPTPPAAEAPPALRAPPAVQPSQPSVRGSPAQPAAQGPAEAAQMPLPTGIPSVSTPVATASPVPVAPRRSRGLLPGAITVLAVGVFAGLYLTQPDLFGLASHEERPGLDAGASAAPAPAPIALGTVTVDSEPPGAEVLLQVGRGPADVEHLPVGVAHEFLVRAADGRVTRALLPADATFTPTTDGPDTLEAELAIQLPSSQSEAAGWPAPLSTPAPPPDSPGSLGTVHVVTNPVGAHIFLRVGVTPRASIPNVRIDERRELFVVKEGHVPSRIVLTPSEWRRTEDGSWLQRVVSKLDPEARSRRRRQR